MAAGSRRSASPSGASSSSATRSGCYVRAAAYGAFAVADAGVRPGLVIDQLEQVLLRPRRRGRGATPSGSRPRSAAPSGKPRTSLHPRRAGRARPPQPPVRAAGLVAEPTPACLKRQGRGAASSDRRVPDGRRALRRRRRRREAPRRAASAAGRRMPRSRRPEAPEEVAREDGPPRSPTKRRTRPRTTAAVDGVETMRRSTRCSLAKEFSGLLQEDERR